MPPARRSLLIACVVGMAPFALVGLLTIVWLCRHHPFVLRWTNDQVIEHKADKLTTAVKQPIRGSIT